MPKLAKFAFNLGTRVFIPDDQPLQGVISGRKQTTGSENEYDVHYLMPDLQLAYLVCSESILIGAQPAPAKPAARKRR